MTSHGILLHIVRHAQFPPRRSSADRRNRRTLSSCSASRTASSALRYAIGRPGRRASAGFGLHLGRHSEDPGARAGPRSRFLGFAGRHRGRRWSAPASPSMSSTSATLPAFSAMIRTVGALVGAAERAEHWRQSYEAEARPTQSAARGLRHKPKVYFEEWDDPLISGIGWVSRTDRDRRRRGRVAGFAPSTGRQRPDHCRPTSCARPQPDVILASWCGKKVVPDRIRKRAGLERDSRRSATTASSRSSRR